MSAAVPVAPVAVTVRLSITHTAGWGVFARHLDTTVTGPTIGVAFVRAYRYARFLMGGHSTDSPAWTAYHADYGWSLETMDAHHYRVRIITTPGAASADNTLTAPPVPFTGPRGTDVAFAEPEWIVTVPLMQTVPAATPAAAIARACQSVEDATALWWPAIAEHPAITVNAL